MPVDRKAQLMVTSVFRSLSEDEREELVALLVESGEPQDAGDSCMTACSIKTWCKKRNGHRGACYPFHQPAPSTLREDHA